MDDSNWEWTVFTALEVPRLTPPDVIWMRKRFDLQPTEACMRYFLRCDRSSYPMRLYLRGKLIEQTGNDDAIDIDVTDFLSLDDNILVLAIHARQWDLDPQISDLYLQPIFCDDLV